MANRRPVRAINTTEQLLSDIRDQQDEILDELRKLNRGSKSEPVGIQEPVEQPSTRKESTKKAPAKKAPAKKTSTAKG